MIKLFWNTHNFKKQRDKEKISTKLIRDYKWGVYHKKSSDKWIYEILGKIKYKIILSEDELEQNDILIIIDSSIEEKENLYEKLNLICSKIFLFHLGDEPGIYDFSNIYNKCSNVWRTFCSNKYFKDNKVKCIPIGYKSGVINNKEKKRKYKWSFVGTPHKSSRHDLLFQLSEIKPFYTHITKKFDENIISVDQMNEVLSSSHFMPCPNGFVHPETYRIYEALECGCIPIVENAYNYYSRLFPKNPFIAVNKWLDAKNTIKNWKENQIEEKRNECIAWWQDYKIFLKDLIYKNINNE